MNTEERRRTIVDLVTSSVRASVSTLAAECGVSVETIRRDLASLEAAGLVRRVHGAAVAAHALELPTKKTRPADAATPLGAPMLTPVERAIARTAICHVLPRVGGSIVMDGGPLSCAVAAHLNDLVEDVSVHTNDLAVAAHLAPLTHIELHLLPGGVPAQQTSATGGETLRALGSLQVDFSFVSAQGVAVGYGLSVDQWHDAAVRRAMVAAGRRVVALVQSHQFDVERAVQFAALTDVDLMVTDSLPPGWPAELSRAGIRLVKADIPSDNPPGRHLST